MGLIKEPLDVDFYVESKPLTNEKRELISKHIREYKANIPKGKLRTGVVKENTSPETSKKSKSALH
jgi:hypothetical protein